ncbi:AI-2E family transporter [Arthrobacter sp. B6]|uniref:AI-2E family transporter n=1 Tax=Arthrobacter sp. B6 TaxID=1570137 RepID=UPI000829B612|nr:AI-2E family transporter [Arthrobacter sp. B6]
MSASPADGKPNVWTTRVGHAAVRLNLAILAVLAVVLATIALRAVNLVLVPVLIALLLTAAIRPLVHFLEDRSIPKPAATFISLFACVVVLLGIGAGVAYSISTQWDELVSSSDAGLARVDQTIAQSPLPFSEQEVRQARESAVRSLTGDMSVGDAFAALNTIGTFLTGLLMMIVVLFFFLKDGQTIWAFLTRWLHGDRLARTMRAGKNAVEVMGAYVRGIMVIASIDAAGIGLAMLLLGVPLALPLTAIVFLGGFIPVAGATITGIFVVLFAFVTKGGGAALALAVAVIAVQQLEGNLMQPVIMGNAVKLHPLVILLVLAIGGILAGIIGAILAVPIAAVIWTSIKSWNKSLENDQNKHEQKGLTGTT